MSSGRRTRTRTWLSRALALGVALLVGELIALVAHVLMVGGGHSSPRLTERRTAVAAGQEVLGSVAEVTPAVVLSARQSEVIHPYVGFVLNPDRADASRRSRLGFLDDPTPPSQAEETLTVGVFGGSVAANVALSAQETVRQELEARGMLEGRRLVLHCLALGGGKQPQQTFALLYLLLAGARFDVVVNLDGFNELAITVTENVPKGVSLMYPRHWSTQVQGQIDPEDLLVIGRLALLRDDRRAWARLFDRPVLRLSTLAGLIWEHGDARLSWRLVEEQMRLQGHRSRLSSFVATGPRMRYADDGEVYREIARIWKESSRQMQHICRENGIRYHHFLQPNQYVAGSKEMGREEQRIALREDHPYRRAVERGYPLLRAAGGELRQAGVQFHDLTMVFAEMEEPLYVDDCCHVGERGSRILGQAIASAIADAAPDSARQGQPLPSAPQRYGGRR